VYGDIQTVKATETAPITVIVVARPGLMRDSLVSFLEAIPEVDAVQVTEHPFALLDQVHRDAPNTIIVDANLGQGQVVALLRRLRVADAKTRCIVLSDHVWQHDPFLSAGADAVLVKGFLGEPLRRAVLGLSDSIV
jgi:DNA-binding NarL/FixJ family response regulator